MTWEDKIIEAARMAEEAAQVELEQFGYWDTMPDEREGVSVRLECEWVLSGAVRDEREARW